MVSPVHYPIAKDKNGKWVKIAEAQRGNKYFCPECNSSFVLRLGSIRVHHFAHKSGYIEECTGESGYHSLAKHLLAYHFEQKRSIILLSKCPICKREFSKENRVINIQVEKGSDDYRPDVKLLLEEGIVIDCEVVFKNPLGDKLNSHSNTISNLLIWEIDSNVQEVPTLEQKFWEDANEWQYEYKEHLYKNKLLLLASPVCPQHECTPYGVAYVFEVGCYKCKETTKVAFISHWYPMWGDLSSMDRIRGPINYFNYDPVAQTPLVTDDFGW